MKPREIIDIGVSWLAGWLWAEHRHERARGETKRKRRNAGGRSVCLELARARQCEKDTRESWIWDTYMCKSLCSDTRGAPAGYGELERARHTYDYLPAKVAMAREGVAGCSLQLSYVLEGER